MDETTATPPNSLRTDARYYRFGLCGLTTGGKTCLLAAMALPRVKNPREFTATLMPPPKGAAENLKAGEKWVKKARKALQAEWVPPPNAHTDRVTLRYKFTDGKKREAFVELVDYSGELLDSSLSQAVLAAKLRGYFAEVDGFLFVAEHPKPGEKASEMAGYLLHLKEALAAHREDARSRGGDPSAPIALLVNKWDRSGPLARSKDAHEVETRRLDAFLTAEPPPPHAGLLAELRAASSGGCRSFPVSAFGEAVRVPGKKPGEFVEIPVRVTPELPSFGLEDPFLWLVEQRDCRDADDLDGASRNPNLWWNAWAAIRCWLKAHRTAARISPASPDAPRLGRMRRRLRARFAAHLALLTLLWLGIELSKDAIALRHARAAMSNPADADGWTEAETWFTNYAESWPTHHVLHKKLFLSAGGASAELQSARMQRDEKSWAAVTASADEATRVALSDDYLKNFPRGDHREEAIQLRTDADTRQKRDRLRAQFQTLAGRLDSVAKEVAQAAKNTQPDFQPASEKLQQLWRDAQNVPGVEMADAEMAKQWQNIIAGIGALDAKIQGQLAAGKSRKTYYDLIERKEWENAGRHLAGLSANEFPDLRDHFRTNIMPQVQVRAFAILGNGADWQKGLAFLAGFQSAQLRPLLPEDASKRFAEFEKQVNEKGDSWLYAQCNSSAGPEPFTEYLANAPFKSMDTPMRAAAKKWGHFYDLRKNGNTYRVGVAKIVWGPSARNADGRPGAGQQDNVLSISVGASKPVETTFWSDRESAWTPNPADHAAVVKDVVAGNPLNIDLKVWDKDWPDGNDYLGGVKVPGLLDELHGLTRDLVDAEYGPNTATFCVDVLDGGKWVPFKKPDLPQWEAPK